MLQDKTCEKICGPGGQCEENNGQIDCTYCGQGYVHYYDSKKCHRRGDMNSTVDLHFILQQSGN